MAKEAWELQDARDGHAAALWEHGQRISGLFQCSPMPPEVREGGGERGPFFVKAVLRNDPTSSCVHSSSVVKPRAVQGSCQTTPVGFSRVGSSNGDWT